ncbi:MAG: hypothetical protein ACRDOS_00195 [Gaiellaceae bacterium]
MIRCERTSAGPVAAGELSPGATAYVDADWLPAESAAAIPALVVHPNGTITWGDSPPVALAEDVTGADAVASALLRLAREASLVVPESARDACDVPGRGVVAEWVRRLLDPPAQYDDDRSSRAPRAIVETRSDAGSITAATGRLADLGTLVLAGEGGSESLSLDLYPDVHVRGLRIVGVAAVGAGPIERGDEDRVFLDALPGMVTDVRLGSVLPEHARCYRVSA